MRHRWLAVSLGAATLVACADDPTGPETRPPLTLPQYAPSSPPRGIEYRPKPRDEIARNMAAIRSKENKTERALRQMLHRRGFRFRKYSPSLPGKPDIVFPTERIAVFVDGDYWHARLLRERGEAALLVSIKNPNVDYWAKKFRRNVDRDDAVTQALQGSGWEVLRFWESDVKRDLEATAKAIARNVLRRRRFLRPLPKLSKSKY